MSGDSDHKPLKPAHPAVKSIAGMTAYKLAFTKRQPADSFHCLICNRAGSIGGAAEACCLQPIDVIKTRLQLDHIGKYKGKTVCFQVAM